MSHLMALKAKDLPKNFDIKRHGEKPVVEFDFKDNIIEISYIFPGFTISHQPQKVDDNADHKPSSFNHEVGISGTGFFSENGSPTESKKKPRAGARGSSLKTATKCSLCNPSPIIQDISGKAV